MNKIKSNHSLGCKVLSLLLCALMVLSVAGESLPFFSSLFSIKAEAVTAKSADAAPGDLTFVVPEAIYLYPNASSWTSTTSTPFQYYVNNNNDGSVKTGYDTTGYIYYSNSGSNTANISYSFFNSDLSSSISGGSVTLSSSSVSNDNYVSITGGTSPSLAASTTGFYIRWELSFYDSNDNVSKKIYAYTYVYKPYVVPLASTADAGSTSSNTSWAGSTTWISGVHSITPASSLYGVDGKSADNHDLYYASYSNFSAFISKDKTGYIGNTAVTGKKVVDWNSNRKYSVSDGASEGYIVFAESGQSYSYTNGSNSSSPYGLDSGGFGIKNLSRIKYKTGEKWSSAMCINPGTANIFVDTSRYSNFSQVPNLMIGLTVNDDESSASNSGNWYIADATGLTNFTNDACFTSDSNRDSMYNDKNTIIAGQTTKTDSYSYEETEGPRYAGVYNRSIDSSINKYTVHGYFGTQDKYARASSHEKVFLATTQINKGTLRTAVNNAIKQMAKLGVNGVDSSGNLTSVYFDNASSNNTWGTFTAAYKAAAEGLTKLDASCDAATLAKNLNDAVDGLKTKLVINPNGGSYNGSTNAATVYENVAASGTVNASVNYAFKTPTRDGYNFGGWATNPNDTTGKSGTITVGYNQTWYAIWLPIPYNTFYNLNYGTNTRVNYFGAADALLNQITSVTSNGITCTYNPTTNEFTLNGSSSAEAQYFYFPVTMESGYYTLRYTKISGSVNYTGSACIVIEGVKNASGAKTVDGTGHANGRSNFDVDGNSSMTKQIYVGTGVEYIQFRSWIGSGRATYSNLKFKVEIYKGTTADIANQAYSPNANAGKYQQSYTLPQNPTRTGYDFGGWYNEAACTNAASASQPSKDRTVYAKWTPIKYYVEFNGNGANGGSMAKETFTYDVSQALTKNAFTRNYTVTFNNKASTVMKTDESYYADSTSAVAPITSVYTFNGWSKSADGAVDFGNEATITNYFTTTDTLKLYAKWTPKAITLPSPGSYIGYNFDGWYDSASGGTKIGNAGDSYTPKANITLYAHWSPKQYTVKFDTQVWVGSNQSVGSTQDVFPVFGAAMPAINAIPTKEGYQFGGYYAQINGAGKKYYEGNKNSGSKWNVDSDAILYAYWIPNKYSVRFNGNGSNTGETMSNQTNIVYDASTLLNANNYKRQYTVVYNLNTVDQNGNNMMNTNRVNYTTAYYDNKAAGETKQASFNGWATSVSGSVAYANKESLYWGHNLTSVNNATVDLYAKWSDIVFTLPSPTRDGYTFQGWYTAQTGGTRIGDASSNYHTLTISSSEALAQYAKMECYAQWKPRSYTVVLNNNDLDGSANKTTKEFTVTFGAVPSIPSGYSLPTLTGYHFGGYYAQDYNTQNSTYVPAGEQIFAVDGKAANRWNNTDTRSSLYALWVANDYTIKYDGNGANSGSMTDQARYYNDNGTLRENRYAYNLNVVYDFDAAAADELYDTSTTKLTNPTVDATVPVSKKFDGWSYSSGAENSVNVALNKAGNIDHADGSAVSYNGNTPDLVTLYAVWSTPTIKLKKPMKVGYTFEGWKDDGGKIWEAGADYQVTEPVKFTAQWKKINIRNKFVAYDFASDVNYNVFNYTDSFGEAFVPTVYASAEPKAPADLNKASTTQAITATTLNAPYSFTSSGLDSKVTYDPNGKQDTKTVYFECGYRDYAEVPMQYISTAVTFVPANSVYYEESVFKTPDKDVVSDTDNLGVDWENAEPTEVTAGTGTDYQAYGYSVGYSNNSAVQFSNGTALTAVVSPENQISKFTEYRFTGRGFDIYSERGQNTSALMIYVWYEQGPKDFTLVENALVDTSLTDTTLGVGAELMYQVPVYRFSSDTSRKYLVQVCAVYMDKVTLEEVDDNNLLGVCAQLEEKGLEVDSEKLEIMSVGTDIQKEGAVSQTGYIDGIRIYKPTVDEEKYYSWERSASFYNILQYTANGDSFTAYKPVFDTSLESANPFNEIYLAPVSGEDGGEEAAAKTAGYAFKVSDITELSEYRVMLSLRSANGAPVVYVSGSSSANGRIDITLNHATEMYYDITDVIGSDGIVYVTLAGDGIAAICNVKVTTKANGSDGIPDSLRIAPLNTFEVNNALNTFGAVRGYTPVSYVPLVEEFKDEPEESGEDEPVVPQPGTVAVTIPAKKAEYTVGLKSTVKLTAVASEAPSGSVIRWYTSDNRRVGEGSTCELKKMTQSAAVHAQLESKDGSTVYASSNNVKINVKTGIFQVIIAFFKGLFGMLSTVDVTKQ